MKVAPALFALILSSSATAADGGDRHLGDTIRRALADQGEIVTLADHRAIAAKCSLPADATPRNVRFTDGGLHCPDGRIVRDAETRAMADRIGARATAVATAAMNKPEVVAAIHAHADAASIAAIERLRRDQRRVR